MSINLASLMEMKGTTITACSTNNDAWCIIENDKIFKISKKHSKPEKQKKLISYL